MQPTRRTTLLMMLGLGLGFGTRPGAARAGLFDDNPDLAMGQSVWEPSQSDSGPVFIAADSSMGLVRVWRGGIEIGIAHCSPPIPAGLPDGIFHLAPQQGPPDPQAVGQGWSGHRVHFEHPAQRALGPSTFLTLPAAFARALALEMPLGAGCLFAPALANGQIGRIVDTDADFLLPPSPPVAALLARQIMQPARALAGYQAPASLVLSPALGRAGLFESGKRTAAADLVTSSLEPLIGTWTFQLLNARDGGITWLAIGTGPAADLSHIEALNALGKITFADSALGLRLLARLRVGSLIVVARPPSQTVSRVPAISPTRLETGALAAADFGEAQAMTLFGAQPPTDASTVAGTPPVSHRRSQPRAPAPRLQAAPARLKAAPRHRVSAAGRTATAERTKPAAPSATVRSIFQPY